MSGILIYGTIAMVLLAITVVVFALFYQRKMFEKQKKLVELEIENQRKLIEAEINASEREQKRIAQDLHDDTGASLTSLRFYIAQLGDEIPQRDEMNQILTETTHLVKHVCNDLLPYIIEELGIVGAIEHVANRLNATSEIEVNFIRGEIVEDIYIAENEELALYRIIQELLNNIIKYAESTYIDISVDLTPKEFKIEITDDGTGIIPNLDGHINSFGLRNIVSRLQYVDATMVRSARRQRGTTVVIRKPLNEKENHNRRR